MKSDLLSHQIERKYLEVSVIHERLAMSRELPRKLALRM